MSPTPPTPPTPITFQFSPQTPPSASVSQHNNTPPPTSLISNDSDEPTSASSKGVGTQSKHRLRQMYIDLGQKDFGRQIVCKTCGMLYVHGMEEDAEQHKRICQNFQFGVPFQAKQGRVVHSTPFGDVVEIRRSDGRALRKKVDQVRTIVDRDLGYLRSNHREPNHRITYFFVRRKRVVGMVSVELISYAFLLKSSLERSTKKRNAMVGVHQLWVHAKHRKQGVASTLIDAVREKFVFGMVVPPEMLAFSSPTEAGAKFAQRYVGSAIGRETNVLVYDCN